MFILIIYFSLLNLNNDDKDNNINLIYNNLNNDKLLKKVYLT